MAPRVRTSVYVVAGASAFAVASFLIFREYLTPEMMVYFLTFKWCM